MDSMLMGMINGLLVNGIDEVVTTYKVLGRFLGLTDRCGTAYDPPPPLLFLRDSPFNSLPFL